MNIFDQNYLEDYYADESPSKQGDKLTDELKYALHLEKMFSSNKNLAFIYCNVLAFFLLGLESGLIKKDKLIVDSLKKLIVEYFSYIKGKIDVLPESTDLSLDSELVKSSAYLVLQLAEQGFMLQGVTIKFTDVFNSSPSNMNITVKSSKICLTDHADAFLNDFKFIQEIGDYSKRLDKLSTLLGEVITVILDVYDNRYLKIK